MCGVGDEMKRLICVWCTGVSPSQLSKTVWSGSQAHRLEGISNGKR